MHHISLPIHHISLPIHPRNYGDDKKQQESRLAKVTVRRIAGVKRKEELRAEVDVKESLMRKLHGGELRGVGCAQRVEREEGDRD